MRDPDERAASLGVREGNAAQVRAAVDWYRNHDRLRSGDDVVMAADALDGYRFDVAAGKDALLVCSTTETADALNHRLHHEHRSGHSEAVTGVRDHRIGVGDLILTRANDPTIALQNADKTPIQDRPVRNGHRWRVAAIDPTTNRLAAERVDDSARAVFDSDYVKDSISLGYAVTVHSAQGVTADTTHAVLSENTTRSLLYVAVTRGRESNTIYLCERVSESEYVAAQTDTAATVRDTGGQAAAKLITIALQKDDRPSTALDLAQQAPAEALPGRVTALRDYTAKQLADLRQIYRGQHTASTQSRRAPDQSRGRSLDSGIEL